MRWSRARRSGNMASLVRCLFSAVRTETRRIRPSHGRMRPGARAQLLLQCLEPRLAMASGASLVTDINRVIGPDCSDAGPLVEFWPASELHLPPVAYFAASDPIHGRELWRTDGTPSGTTRFADINPGTLGSDPTDLTVAGSSLFFVATHNGVRGLWKTDGTEAGTVLVKNISGFQPSPNAPADTSYSPYGLVAAGNRLYFVATDYRGTELWTSDGTTDGTTLVKDINETEYTGGVLASSYPYELTPHGARLYFGASDKSGTKLWATDGTASGTTVVADVAVSGMVSTNSGLFYTAFVDGRHRLYQYAYDLDKVTWPFNYGAVKTSLVTSFEQVGDMVAVGRRALFVADDGNGEEVWASDGSAAGTTRISAISTTGMAYPAQLTVGEQGYGDVPRIYFTADDGVHGREPWVTDGTLHGTRMLEDVYQGPMGSSPTHLRALRSGLAFIADDGLHGRELWFADGRTSSAALVRDLNPDGDVFDEFASATYAAVTSLGATLYFSADQGDGQGLRLWTSDGTFAGTSQLNGTSDAFESTLASASYAAAASLGEAIFFAADDGVHGKELWRTDGTPAGSRMVADLAPGAASSAIQGMTTVGSHVIFSANGKLWATGGTTATTSVLAEGNFTSFQRVGQVLFIRRNGHELWRTDGTPAGTKYVDSFATAAAPDDSSHACMAVGETLFYVKSAGVDQMGRTSKALMAASAGGSTFVVVSPGEFDSFSQFLAVKAGLMFEGQKRDPQTNAVTRGFWTIAGVSAVPVRFTAFDPTDRVIASATEGVAYIEITATINSGIGYNWTKSLWRTDGTAAGTTLLGGPVTGTHEYEMHSGAMYAVGGRMFRVKYGGNGGSLWLADGSSDRERQVMSGVSYIAAVLDSRIVFAADGLLGITDGSTAGTTILPRAPDTTFGPGRIVNQSIGATAFLQAYTRETGTELFRMPVRPAVGTQVPGQVTRVRGAGGSEWARVAWSAPASHGGDPVNAYRIDWTADDGKTWQTRFQAASSGTSAIINGLANGTAYRFRVAAMNSAGTGIPSGMSATVTPMSAPGNVIGLAAQALNGQVSLSWNAAMDGGSPITGYLVQVSDDNEKTWRTVSRMNPEATSEVVSGLINGMPYGFRVAAINRIGVGPYTLLYRPVAPLGVPLAPTGVRPQVDGAWMTISWSAPSDGGRPITDYIIQASTDGGVTWTTRVDGISNSTQITQTGWSGGLPHVFRVAAVNELGTGAFSSLSDPATPLGDPGPIIDLAVTAGDGRVLVSWGAPATDGGTPINSYRIQWSSDGGENWDWGNTVPAESRSAVVGGLTNGTSYLIRVRAQSERFVGPFVTALEAVKPAGVPGVPRSLVATRGDRQVVLAWTAPASDNGSPITDYIVQSSTDGGKTWQTVADAVSSVTSAAVTGLALGTPYVFRVAAVNGAGLGVFTERSAVAVPATVAGSPTNVSGTRGSGQVSLTWTAPALDGGAAITDYKVQTSTDGGLTWSAFADAVSTATNAVVTNLENGKSHVFRVAAVNDVGTGVFSNASAPITPVSVASAPTGVAGTRRNGAVMLSWSAPALNGGLAVTDYRVQFSADAGKTWKVYEDAVSTATSTLVKGLSNGTSYVFRVAAVNGVGTGAYSNASSAVIPAPVADAPTNVAGTRGNGRVTLTWNAPAANGGTAVTDYVVQRSADAGKTWQVFEDAVTSARTAVVTGLTNGTAYIFRVAAINGAGRGPFSAASAAVTPATVASAPRNVVGTRGNGQVTLAWLAPVSDGGTPVADYTVQTSADGGKTWRTFSDAVSNATTAVVTGLANGTPYLFRVAASNNVGAGDFSSASAAVIPATVAGAPINVAGTRGNGQVTLAWTAPASNGGTVVTDYTVQSSGDGGKTWQSFNDSVSTATTVTVTGLANGTAYVFRVAAINGVGTGAYSAASGAVTPAPVAEAPTNVTGIRGNGQVSLSWTAPTSNGGSAVTDYVVQSSKDGGASWLTFADGISAAASAVVTGLSNGTSYVFRVAAVNNAGAGAYSKSSTAVIPATFAGAPTSVAGTRGDSRVALTWTAPASNGGTAVTNYSVQLSKDGGKTWQTFADGISTATNTVVTGLVNGTSYVFRVAAVNDVGIGAFSSASPAVTPATVPDAPTGLAATRGQGTVSLVWKAPASNGGASITDYVVEWSSDSGKTWSVFRDGVSTALRTTVTGLSNGTSYRFRVAAKNVIGTGVFATVTSARVS